MIDKNTRFALTADYDRALDPNNICIDDRSIRDRLNYVSRFAGLIKYYNHENRHSGDWQGFYLKDPVFLLAQIATINPELIQAEFGHLKTTIEKLLEKNQHNRLADLVNLLFNLPIPIYQQLMEWSSWFDTHKDEYYLKVWFNREVKRTIAPEMWQLLDRRALLYKSTYISGIDYPEYSKLANQIPTWQRRGANIILCPDLQTEIRAVLGTVEKVIAFHGRAISAAATEFDRRIQAPSDFPDTTLMVVFLQLLENQQKKMNAFSSQHLDLYYRDILKQSPRPAVPDKVLLIARAKPNTSPYLPTGSLFSAGYDQDKRPVNFCTETDFLINNALIAQVYRLSLTAQSGLMIASVQDADKLTRDSLGILESWELFGEVVDGSTKPMSTGCTIASPELYLGSGTRTLTATFNLSLPSAVDSEQNGDKLDVEALDIDALFKHAKLRFSTADGWLDKSEFQVCKAVSTYPYSFCLAVEFSLTDPAITTPKKPVVGISSPYPLMQLLFSCTDDLRSTPPTLLSIDLTSEVIEAEDVIVANDHGALKPGEIIAPFGPIVNPGSNYYIGSQELFAKQTSWFNLNIKWTNIPKPFFFQTYYHAYNDWQKENEQTPEFTACHFTIEPKIRLQGQWSDSNLAVTPASTALPVDAETSVVTGSLPMYLANADGVCSEIVYFFRTKDGSTLFPGQPDLPQQKLKLDPKLPSGFIRLTVTGPQAGFGGSLYPKVVADVAMKNAATMTEGVLKTLFKWLFRHKTQLLSPPNTPFIPQSSSPTISYGSYQNHCIAKIHSAEPQAFDFYHNGLFKTQAIVLNGRSARTQGSTPSPIALYEPVPASRALYLGLSGATPGTIVSLVVQLMAAPPAELDCTYECLTATDWKTLELAKDSTEGFSSPGIIELKLPNQICTSNPAMPQDLFWIRILAPKTGSRISVELLDTQAVMARRSRASLPLDGNRPYLEPLKVTGPVTRIANLDSVTQPFPSMDGVAAETQGLFYQRVSKRIQNKDRAAFASDYASLVTMAFDDIELARCVWMKPGELEVAVIRKRQNESVPAAFDPTVDDKLLRQVQHYLSSRVSPLARVRVVNFTQIPVMVSANVALIDSATERYAFHNIAAALRGYLSPWIQSVSPSANLDKGITVNEVTSFLREHPDIKVVEHLTLSRGNWDTCSSVLCAIATPLAETMEGLFATTIAPPNPGYIVVSNGCHRVTSGTRKAGDVR